MPVATPGKGALIVRLLDRPVGRVDYSSHHNEINDGQSRHDLPGMKR